jgi:hypothetical protein
MAVQSQPGSRQTPPDWALEPATAWIYLAVSLVLAFTLFPLNWLLAIAAAVIVYLDRRAHDFPAFWWTAGTVLLGPLVYVFFIYKRPRGAVVYSPEAAMSQQARLVRGMPASPVQPGAPVMAAADWYPDPTGKARLRYWNGAEWTDHTAA